MQPSSWGGANFNLAWGEVVTYTFTSLSWGATSGGNTANWTNGSAGNDFTGGIQVTAKKSGANGTSPVSFSNVSKVTVHYFTNEKSGAGAIKVQVGSGTEQSFTVSAPSSNGSVPRSRDFTFSNETGNVKITVDCTTNSIYIKSVDITYTAAPSYTITAQSNNNVYGTVSLEGSVITGTPASGYRYASPAYEVTAGTATISQDGDAFTVTPSSDCTVQINFEAIPTHTATFSINGNTSSNVFAEGAVIGFPNDPDDINGKKFVGWVDAAITGSTDIEPSFVTSATMSDSDVTYYAVFATETPGVLSDKTKTITYNTTNIPTGYGSANTFTEYTLEGVKFKVQQMYKSGSKLQWRASGNSSGTGTMYNTDALLKIQSIVLTYDTNDANKNFTIYVGDEENPTSGTSITPTNEGSVYTYDCSSYNKDYFVLTNGTGAGYLTSIAITYKAVGPTTYSAYCTTVSSLPIPTITFTDDDDKEVTELEINSINTIIPLNVSCSAGDVTLTFVSSDEDVAEYDNEEGELLVYKEGTTTITATFAGNESYQGTSTELIVTVERGTTTLSFPSTSETINIGEIVTSYIATSSPAVSGITYSSDNPSALTVNSTTGEITGVAKGSATITASFAGDYNYKAAETSYTILVVNKDEITYTLTNDQIEENGPEAATGYGSKSITDANGKIWNAYAIKNYHSKGSNHFLQIRAYGNSTAYYIQVPAYGTRITELQMTVSGASQPINGGGNTATLFFSASNSTTAAGSGVASGTGISSVTIDCSSLKLNTGYITASGAVRIWDVKVTYEYALSVGSALYTTHVTADAVDFTGVTAYVATKVNTETVSLKKVTSAPANTPVVIKADEAKTFYLQTKYSSIDDVSGNLLQASDGTVAGDGSIYALANLIPEGETEPVVGFYQVDKGIVIPAGKAYLVDGAGVKGFTFDFDDDDATAIEKTLSDSPLKDENIYNLAGQRLGNSQLKRGIYIVNGKKILK